MPPRHPLRPGDVLLDRYTLLARLGRGLGGETWKAVPLEGGDAVAVKVIPENADRWAQSDVLNEAAFLRELDHPHVVRYLGMVDLPGGGATFLIMEFVEGGNLWEWLQNHGPCRPELAAALLLQIAEGLRAVHERGILHRDLKPANVLVRPALEGAPRLLVADLGISRRAVLNVAAITRVAGTPGYAAPEAWTGGTLSGAADVYALGAIGWFLLTGREPEPTVGTTFLDPIHLPDLLPPDYRHEAGGLIDLIGAMLSLDPTGRPGLDRLCRELARRAGAEAPAAAPAVGRLATRPLPTPPRVAPPVSNPSLVPLPHPGGVVAELEPAVPAASVTPASLGRGRAASAQPGADSVVGDPWADTPSPDSSSRPWLLGGLAAGLLILGCGGFAWWSGGEAPPTATVDGPPVLVPPVAVVVEAPQPAPAETTPAVAATPAPAAPAAAPPARPVSEPRPAAATPAAEPASVAAPAPASGPIGRLRVGIVSPNGLPADVALVVAAPGGASNRSQSTQVVVPNARSGTVRVSLLSATTTLGEATVVVPPGDEVRVSCVSLVTDFSLLRCEVLP